MWLLQSCLKASTEALIFAAQEQAIRSNSIKYSIDRTTYSPLFRKCGVKVESVRHIISGCEKLSQNEYKRRHEIVARIIHWKLCAKYGFEVSEKWYEHKPEEWVAGSRAADASGIVVYWMARSQTLVLVESSKIKKVDGLLGCKRADASSPEWPA